jgi:hypothetical protein
MRTLGNFSYILAVAFLIASLAVNAMPVQTALAGGASATMDCPLPEYNSTHYALQPGQSVTCTIHNADLSGSPDTVDVYIQSSDLGNSTVTGHVSGSNITFSYTGNGSGCNTTVVKYDNGDGSKKNIDGKKGFGFVDASGNHIACGGGGTSTPTTPADTATPTDTPEDPTATPTGTPDEPTATPTGTPVDPTATPTDFPGDPTATPTGDPGDPTATPTNTPEDPHGTETTTPSANSLTVSSFCGPNAKHVNWWKISNSSADEVSVSWQIQPGGAPADAAQVPASGEYEFSTVKVTDSDNLDVYFDTQGQQFAGSAEAAEGCTHPGETPHPGATFIPAPSGQTQVLIPVTGANLSTGGSLRLVFFNLGIGFLGLGLVLNGLSRERKNPDL